MLGAILGDIIGSTYEFANTKNYNFELFPLGSDFTDDSVLTVAVADAILRKTDYGETIRAWALKYPNPKGAYGGSFLRWMHSDNPKPYGSFGNGSAMRVSAVGWLFDTESEVLNEARKSASCTHNHPEGIKGAQATAIALFFARKGKDKNFIKQYIEQNFGYDLNKTVAEIRKIYSFNETCQGTLPEALVCFLESTSFEDAIRNAVSIGGDSDTIGAIVGGIAEAYYGIPEELQTKALSYLPDDFRTVLNDFNRKLSEKSIDLSNERKKRHARYERLCKEFSELFIQKNKMLSHDEPFLTALYLKKIGVKLYEVYCLNVELSQLKLRLSLMQAYVNRNEQINSQQVDNEVERAFSEYKQKIEEEARRIASATEFLKGSFLSLEDSRQLKQIYYTIVKRLHPDVNPNLSEEMKDLFVKAQVAYELCNLDALKEVLLVLDIKGDKIDVSIPDLEKRVEQLQKNVNMLNTQIEQLKATFPFMHEQNLSDEDWIKSQRESADCDIDLLNKEIEKYKEYISLLEEWKPE